MNEPLETYESLSTQHLPKNQRESAMQVSSYKFLFAGLRTMFERIPSEAVQSIGID